MASPAWATARGGGRGGGGGHGGGYHSSSSYVTHSAGPVTGGYHAAGPVGSGGYYGGGRYYAGGTYYGGPRATYSYGYGYGTPYPYSRYYWGWGYRYYPWSYAAAPLTPVEYSAPAPLAVFTVGATGQLVQGGGALGVDAMIEGQRFGFVADFNNVAVGSLNDTSNLNQYRLLDGHLTYAVIADPHGRLRIEGGLDSAFLGSSILVGPGVGASAGLGLVGPVGLEASVRVTPIPYRELDAMAGLSLGLGPLAIRGGYRYTFLDDTGHVDGTDHTYGFAGPYVGLALSI